MAERSTSCRNPRSEFCQILSPNNSGNSLLKYTESPKVFVRRAAGETSLAICQRLAKIVAIHIRLFLVTQYSVIHLPKDLGWVDLDLGSSPGCGPLLQLPTAQAGWWNIPNLSQPNQVPHLTPQTVPTAQAGTRNSQS